MRITLLGVLGAVALAALLIYVGYELNRTSGKREPPPPPPPPPPQIPNPPSENT